MELKPVCELEQLEQRVLLAGDVTAALAGNVLKMQGDNLHNYITVTQVGGGFTVTGNATTVNGLAADTILGAPTKIKIEMNKGQCDVILDTLVFTGTINVKGGKLADYIVATGDNITGKLLISTGAGDDTLILSTVTATTGVFKGGSGADTIQESGVVITNEKTSSFTPLAGGLTLIPTITAAQVFTLPENSINGTIVGSVAYTYSGADALTWAITGGNGLGGFAINAASGQITVANQAVLDFEINPTFALTVSATNTHFVSGTGTVTVNLTNVLDPA